MINQVFTDIRRAYNSEQKALYKITTARETHMELVE
jgi:hypothetical protein